MPLVRGPYPNYANASYIDQLGKRNGALPVQKDQDNYYYCASLITSSGSIFKVAVDTGSAYTWVGAIQHNPYVEGDASRATGVTTEITYAGDTVIFVGETYNDSVTLGTLVIDPQGIGIPRRLENFPAGIDGILGLGPTTGTHGMGSDGKLIPTVVDNLYSQGAISSHLFGVYFMPENVGRSGLLLFGYIYEAVLTSDVRYVSVTKNFPGNIFWSVDATIMYGSNTLLSFGSGVFDTAAEQITIANDAFSVYQLATGGVLHSSGWFIITQDQYNKLQPLSFLIGGESYDLSPNAQIRARPSPNSPIVLIVQSEMAEADFAFVLGMPFFQRFYVVFNSGSNEIGFASHIHTDSTSN
ncbi:hypothetical protein ID866_6078 [Astraeus odoratus]|nr:hypothetical protein ID866_6078 [Astraeus odoratus]